MPESVTVKPSDVGTLSLDPSAPAAPTPVTHPIFCAACQSDTPHSLVVDKNNEIVATCDDCRHHIKLPFTTNPAELAALLARHKESNTGQVSAASVEVADAKKHEALRSLIGGVVGKK